MKQFVFDSSAVISYLDGEPNAEKVADVLEDINNKNYKGFICVVNLGEIYYHFLRTAGIKVANLAIESMTTLPIEIINADTELTLSAAKYKAFNKMSYADCFAAALTDVQNAILVTSDKEFKQIETKIKIIWI